MTDKDQNEQWIMRTLERLGAVNQATLMVTPQVTDSLWRLLDRGVIRKVGFSSAVELAPAACPKPVEQPCPEARRPHKSYREGRRQHYSQLTGMTPDRIKQL